MKDWQIDAFWEAETSKEWEQRNAEDPAETKLNAAADDMSEGILKIESGLEWLQSAAEKLNGNPIQAVINSLIYSIEQAEIDALILSGKIERGEIG